MNAIKLLKSQHREISSLFKQYESSKRRDQKAKLFAEIADTFAAHGAIEEKIFYPAAFEGERLQRLLLEAVEEHLSVKRIFAELLEMNVDDESFDAKMKVAKEQIEHHVEEEHEDMFPKVERLFSDDQLEELGGEMKAMFDDLIDAQPRVRLPRESKRSPSLHP